MNALGDLREAFRMTEFACGDEYGIVLDVLDAFEAAHPGLVDQTLTCDTCGQPYKGPGTMMNRSTVSRVDVRVECPACAEVTP